MLLQLIVLAAGVYVGRKLSRTCQSEAAGPQDAEAVEAKPSEPLLERPTTPAEREADRQIRTALVATCVTTTAVFFPPLRLLGGASVLYGALPLFKRAKEILFDEERLGIEVLDSAGVISSVASRQYVVSAVMFLLYSSSVKLRLRTERAAQQSMIDVFGRRPDYVWLDRAGVEVRVPFDALEVGDVVVVDPSAPIPVDGIVVEGAGLVDQHMLTGESQPVEKGAGDRVFATTIVCSGRLHVRTETRGRDTVASQISLVLRRTADFTAALESQGQKIADSTVVPTLALSVLSYPVVGAQGSVALLNAGFLDNMRLIWPYSMLNHLRFAYEAGILVKDGRSLQLLRSVDTIVFDKTGTLTMERLRVREIYPQDGVGSDEVLGCAAVAEFRQTHPLARAILDEAERRGQLISITDHTHYEVGYGLTVTAGGQAINVGSRRFFALQGIELPDALAAVERSCHDRGCSLVYVARGRVLLGMIELEPMLRPEIAEVIRALRARGLGLYILSGDHEAPTRAVADALGLDGYFAGILPHDKAGKIEELQAQGRTVCFVGDGINDAIALKKATVSISMSGASTVATDSAQVVMMDQGLAKLPELFALGDDFQRNMRDVMVAVSIPNAIGVAGVFLAGFTVSAMTALYVASVASGMLVAWWPSMKRAREQGAAAPHALPAGAQDGHDRDPTPA